MDSNSSPYNKFEDNSPSDTNYAQRISSAESDNKKRKAICLDCGHEWEARNPSGTKPSRCSSCKSHQCAWKDELESDISETANYINENKSSPEIVKSVPNTVYDYMEEKPVITQAADILHEYVRGNVQIIENPIENLGASATEPNYAIWKKPDGAVECGIIVNPEVYEILENASSIISDVKAEQTGLKDLEILKAAGYINDEIVYDENEVDESSYENNNSNELNNNYNVASCNSGLTEKKISAPPLSVISVGVIGIIAVIFIINILPKLIDINKIKKHIINLSSKKSEKKTSNEKDERKIVTTRMAGL